MVKFDSGDAQGRYNYYSGTAPSKVLQLNNGL